jgi:pimeloyl-ACP methyl ester carboxylesterase
MPVLDHGGVRIVWESTGSGPPLLLLHGLGGGLVDWEPQIAPFAARYRVIRLDVRGHGASDKRRGRYRVEDFTGDAIAVLRAAGAGPAHVVGLSMGGMIALQMALDAPELVRSLVLANTGPEVRAENLKERIAIWQRRLLTRILSMEQFATALSERLFPEPGQEGMRAEFRRRWAANDPAAYRESYHALLRWSVASRLEQINQPTLVIHSEFDYTSLERKQRWATRIPNARTITIAGARHAVSMDKASAFNRVILEFLETAI